MHIVGLKPDGTVVAWGMDNLGQSSPPQGLSGVEQVVAGYGHSLALKGDGTVVGWGAQSEPPPELSGVIAIAAGGHSLALAAARHVQTITWTTAPPASVTAGQRFPVAATATSGLPVTISTNVTVTTPQPSVRVKLKVIGHKSKFRVDVNPNKGRGYWTFRVQKLQADQTWLTLPKVYKTLGAKETRTVNMRRGTYRVVVDAKYNYAGASSNVVYLRR